jgi:hypothetical protein
VISAREGQLRRAVCRGDEGGDSVEGGAAVAKGSVGAAMAAISAMEG